MSCVWDYIPFRITPRILYAVQTNKSIESGAYGSWMQHGQRGMSVESTHPDALVVSADWPNNHRQIQAILFTSATIYLWNSLQFIYSGFQTGEGVRLPQRGFDLCQHTVLKIECDHKERLDIFHRSQTKDRFTRVWFPVTLVTLFSILVPQIWRSSTLLLFIWELFHSFT